MKVGILTYHFSNNYGALFQAYGLRNCLLEQGIEAEFINYHPEHIESGGQLSLSNVFTKVGLKILFLKLMSLKEKYFGHKQSQEGFDEFRRDFLGVKGREFKTIEDLNAAQLNYDLLICGSDQVWNPSEHFGVDPVYFLDFKIQNPNVRKISYAPSFGKSTVDERFTSEIATLISKLDGVSIREKSGVKIIEKLTDKKPVLVPDPTTLVSNYTKVMKEYPVKNDNYVFCYYLRSRKNIGETAEYIASKTNAALYSPHNPHRRWKEIGETIYPCPRQWLSLLNSSKFMVTNSFHGTILSILLNKPFVVVGIGGARAKYNERAMNLLIQCGLEHRFITSFDREQIDRLLEEKIDWEMANIKVEVLKRQGLDFLMPNFGEKL